jgi:hypothetical protein
MNQKTKVIYLIGFSGTGKYTIAKEIAKAGYRIADNQLINNPIFELLGYDGFATIPETAWEAIGKIRTAVLDFIKGDLENNYILTNELLEDEGDHRCYNQVKQIALMRNSLFIPVKLHISREENSRRIANPERALRYKSLSIDDNHNKPLISVQDVNMLELGVSNLSAAEVAKRILEFVGSCDRLNL